MGIIDLHLPQGFSISRCRICFNRDLTLLAIDDMVYSPIAIGQDPKATALPSLLLDSFDQVGEDQLSPDLAHTRMTPEMTFCSRYIVYKDSGSLGSYQPRLEAYRLDIIHNDAFRMIVPENLELNNVAYAKFVMHPSLPVLGIVTWTCSSEDGNIHSTLQCWILELESPSSSFFIGQVSSDYSSKLLHLPDYESQYQHCAVSALVFSYYTRIGTWHTTMVMDIC